MLAESADSKGQGLFGRAIDRVQIMMGLGAIVVAFGVAFLPSIQWVFAEWAGSSGVLSHGYLVAAISVYLFVRAVPEVSGLPIKPMWSVLPVLLGLSIAWLLGYVSTIIAIQTVILPAALLIAIAAAFGLQVARRFAFPILFLYLAIPAIEHFQFIFQAITVWVVGVLIRITDMPALINGNFIHLPQGTFEIAGGCSGLNFIVAGLSLSIFYGHMFYSTIRQNVYLSVLTLAVAMAGNWVRVFAVIVLGYRTDMQSPFVSDHLMLGWILFAILMVPVYFAARRIEVSDTKANVHERHLDPGRRPGRSPNWGAVAATVIAMIAGPVWANTISSPNSSAETIEIEFPTGRSGWTGPEESYWGWQPEFANSDAESVVEYRSDSEIVLAYTNVYLWQEQDRELIYFSNDIAGDWQTSSNDGAFPRVIDLDDGKEYGQTIASNYIGDWLIWYRYQNGEVFDATAGQAKISQAVETLKGRPRAGIVAFATPCRDECAVASDRLESFIKQIGYSINLNIVREQQ